MTDPEPSATPEAPAPEVGTPPQAVTEPEAPAQPTEPKANGDTDWRKAFESLQKADSRKARRLEELQQGNTALAEALGIIRKQQEATLKATLPAEQAEAIIAETKASEAALRQQSNIEKASEVLKTQQLILTHTMEQFGLDPTKIDWANDARTSEEYQERVTASINEHVGKSRETLLRSVGKAVEANTKAEKARLEDEKRKEMKALGADKIDTATGTSSTFAGQLARMDPNSKEFAELTQRALDGRLRGIALK